MSGDVPLASYAGLGRTTHLSVLQFLYLFLTDTPYRLGSKEVWYVILFVN